MDAIILSGMPAVGKTTVARILASKLNVPVLGGGDILKEIALEEGYKAVGDDWWDTREGMDFMEQRRGSPEFDREVDRRLIEKANHGDVVITSYTLPWIADDGTKVWLAGSTWSRANRMAKRDSSTPERCTDVIKERDRENYNLYKSLYGIEFGKDLAPFDLIVATDEIEAEQVAAAIMKDIQARLKEED